MVIYAYNHHVRLLSPELWSSTTTLYSGLRSRHCYEIIEAQLAPDNYLYTHSLMFTFDCYTQTGINAAIKLNDQWSILFGIHAGDDIPAWNGAAHPTGMGM